ncbi:MAG: S1 RNA-binding domain-containing protein [Phycisphaerae bacterium]
MIEQNNPIEDSRDSLKPDAGEGQSDSSAGQPLDADLDREVEAAMAQMSPADLADLTGEPPQVQGDDSPGTTRAGKIVGIYEDDVFIDLGGKTQAITSRSQFGKEEVLQVGRQVEVIIERYDSDSGCLIVSRDGVLRQARWDSLRDGAIVEGKVTGMNKGGLEVDLNGIRAFMPASQVDAMHIKDISTFIGQKVRCVILEHNRKSRSVLLSRKKVQEQEKANQKEELMADLAVGQVRNGVVGNLTDFGAFVDLGGVDGLVHISDLSYGQVTAVGDVLKPGQPVEVKILKVDKDRGRISLGLKQTQPDPWEAIEQKYPLDSEVTARVLRLERFGAIVELEAGVEALIPLSEMSWGRISRAADVLEGGQMVTARVIRVSQKERRLALSLKQVQADPWGDVLASFPKDSKHSGKVTKCESFGAFVQLVPGVEGLVHISELSNQRVKQCEDVVKPGDDVEVRILGVDADARRISLSIKAAGEDVARSSSAEGQASSEHKQQPKKKRKKPLRGGLSSHYEWQGNSLNIRL